MHAHSSQLYPETMGNMTTCLVAEDRSSYWFIPGLMNDAGHLRRTGRATSAHRANSMLLPQKRDGQEFPGIKLTYAEQFGAIYNGLARFDVPPKGWP